MRKPHVCFTAVAASARFVTAARAESALGLSFSTAATRTRQDWHRHISNWSFTAQATDRNLYAGSEGLRQSRNLPLPRVFRQWRTPRMTTSRGLRPSQVLRNMPGEPLRMSAQFPDVCRLPIIGAQHRTDVEQASRRRPSIPHWRGRPDWRPAQTMSFSILDAAS